MEYKFTAHAKYRLKKRELTEQEIIEAINHTEKILKKYGKYYAQKNIGRGKIEVVFEKKEKYINIIIIYWI